MRRSILATAATLLTAVAVPAQPALAQGASERPSITVLAPRARQTGRDSATGAPIETLTAQSIVYTDDLNLATEAGRDQLDERIEVAAREACEWLDEVYPMSPTMTGTTAGDCVSEAVARTSDQVEEAVAAYRPMG